MNLLAGKVVERGNRLSFGAGDDQFAHGFPIARRNKIDKLLPFSGRRQVSGGDIAQSRDELARPYWPRARI
jgi:hypothetical protein